LTEQAKRVPAVPWGLRRQVLYVFFPIFEPPRNKQPIELTAGIYSPNQQIGRLEDRKNTYVKIVSFVTEKLMVNHP